MRRRREGYEKEERGSNHGFVIVDGEGGALQLQTHSRTIILQQERRRRRRKRKESEEVREQPTEEQNNKPCCVQRSREFCLWVWRYRGGDGSRRPSPEPRSASSPRLCTAEKKGRIEKRKVIQ
jgi:hypothetical protein